MKRDNVKRIIIQEQNQFLMDEYVELLILAYFKEYHKDYDLTLLKEKIGISYGMLDEYLNNLIDKHELEYRDNLLSITQSGRIKLMNSELENYSYNSDLKEMYSNIKFELETIYCVHEFSKKKWRGAE